MAEIVGGVIALLLLSCMVLALSRIWRLPFSILLVLAGMSIRWLSEFSPILHHHLEQLEITPELILFVFLPTLIFESSFHLDSRQLRQNLLPVLTLAIPGLLISTGIIGGFLHLTAGFPIFAACLLGAVLSATDPVAVVALFQRLGAPKRLTILVEGESLFNDATALVLAGILSGIVAAGTLTMKVATDGIIDFFVVFIGGLCVGWSLGFLTAWILGKVEADSLIEITLTMTVAYLSFLVAEELFHVSGVMATVAAGLTLGGWGRAKISPEVRHSLEHFWEYLAFAANALIFLLVGLKIDLADIWDEVGLLALVLIAMLISRAIVVFGLVPVAGKIPGADPVSRSYQAVMYWGGLRGAIAIAIVLSLPDFQLKETFVTLVIGAVLFTLLVQGISMERLVKFLKLDIPPFTDRYAELEGSIIAKENALDRLRSVQEGGLFSDNIARRLKRNIDVEISSLKKELGQFRDKELIDSEEKSILFLRAFAEEQALYTDLFDCGHLRESTYRNLNLILALQIDSIRFSGGYKPVSAKLVYRQRVAHATERLLEFIPGGKGFAERLRLQRITKEYELDWAHYRGSEQVLSLIDDLSLDEHISAEFVEIVREQYSFWNRLAREHLDRTAAQFPEFVTTMQERLGERLLLHTELKEIVKLEKKGSLPHSVSVRIQEVLSDKLRQIRGAEWRTLIIKPSELLRKVPCFADLSPEDFATLEQKLHPHSVSEKEVIIEQSEKGDELFLIARGVVRVLRSTDGENKNIATLIAGDFFGEMALLHDSIRTATVKAVTPCSLYILRRSDIENSMPGYESIMSALQEADEVRQKEQVE